ncbi:ribonuclease HII [Cryptococcus deuterogattii 99/473]|uniref:Ribonuclease n=2 Tax=Cryptococcus deuterogattii TaxID=1859096 RepID=A0A0D0V249_9TREE|nr:ribonuclease HII [Cryptococcus deuterogattii R265]KIR29198.1 ribonuclease HII [Cryptococcus deuterogattii LA55]KIR34124.1 ribonuclease HII [Cryptococcus deuterogattii MMRL2647]KIR41491.1 ribonuclease HII [Cryptococcus deuterogattii Ram5]KIR71733.1 ribonuclease HII [Cryptococcus deuterogattii CA1014]KIR91316.1 ribonuclease HII [Cryptococcus deuterogattii CBS 10090]KIY56577.1 ribonuclease HII [Cryptococcus deuterogattii 99/473]
MSISIDPVNSVPVPPLRDSYVFHSPLPVAEQNFEEGWIMGIDEAGRGPVLGPMVYAAAYCPLSFKPTLESIGFDDSKALSAETRQTLWETFEVHSPLCYSSSTLSPQDISSSMLRKVPINLNRQAEDSTVGLIQAALNRGINVIECYVDALGPAPQWQARLTAIFPTIKFTVCPKADSLFKIVGAASIVAKVTRDRYVHGWVDPEDVVHRATDAKSEDGEEVIRGSGYPSDPKTQAYLKKSIDPVFGYKGIVRFSWATIKVLLDKQGVESKWIDDTTQRSAANWFSAGTDNERPKVWRDLGVSSVGEL